jgi:hypothetical protein
MATEQTDNEKEKQIVLLAYEVRIAQMAYFKDRTAEKLTAAKLAERALDRALYKLGYRFTPDREETLELPL